MSSTKNAESESLVYLNGTYVPESKATVSVFDHGLLYGDGVFEGIRAYNKRIFKLKEHVDRLYESAHAIKLDIPIDRDELAAAIVETCRKNGIDDGYIRPIVTRGPGDLGLDPRKCPKPNVIIIAKSISLYGDKHETGLKVITTATRRMPPEAFSPNVKSLNYLNNIMAKIEANMNDADEALMLDIHGYVSEASGDNVFIVKNGSIVTPPTTTNLKGITRATAVELAKKRGYPVEEKMLSLFDIYTADEFFMTGTAAEIAPVIELDDRAIGSGTPGPVTRALMSDYHALVRSEGTNIY